MNMVIEEIIDWNVATKEAEIANVNAVREYANSQYADSNVLSEVERTFDGTINEISEQFRRHYGISLEEYISNRRFNAAKELLRFSIKPIENVAQESGIGDIIAMQEMFREYEGMSAEEYRAKWAAWIRN